MPINKKVGVDMRLYMLILILILVSIGTITAGNSDDVKKYFENIPFQMSEINVPVFPDYKVNIIKHGAVGNGQVMNTKAINDAIEQIKVGEWL